LGSYISNNPDYDLIKMLNSGSVAKGTALRTINDMDVAVYVRRARAPVDERRLLEWLAARLREVYPTMAPDQFRVSEHCVRVSFHGSGLDVDVVPVLYEGEPGERGYLVTKETGRWVMTSIPLHLEFVRVRKERHPQHFAQVVRLLKWWVRERSKIDPAFRLKSFIVELLVAHQSDNGLDLSDYPIALELIFSSIVRSGLRERIFFEDNYTRSALPPRHSDDVEIYDPVNPENNVAISYTIEDRDRIVEGARDAFDAITGAHYATTRARAVDLWQTVLGPKFGG
jgi:tRNA nucleotidyltransferase (CCA-adding enzyme)